jgi:hypothetical protein
MICYFELWITQMPIYHALRSSKYLVTSSATLTFIHLCCFDIQIGTAVEFFLI